MDTQPDNERDDAPDQTEENKELLLKIRDRFKVMSEADQENRNLALADLKFVNLPGEQWDTNMRKERGNRPCYEFNKLRPNGKRVINAIRANRPQGKVRAVKDSTKELADLYEGLCRNIANISDLDTITDHAAEYQVDAGMGAWRVVTEYSSDSDFDQDILIKSIRNPFCLYWDPAAQDPLKRDAEDWIITDRLSKSAFEAKYGDTKRMDFDTDSRFDKSEDWEDGETVRVCEYWYKEPDEKEIWQVKGPLGVVTIDSESDEAASIEKDPQYQILKRRTVHSQKIKMCIASGDAILEGPTDWAGKEFPFIVVFGEQKIVDGESRWWGLHRFSKDAQQSYNVSRTSIDETVAQAPKAKFWATAEQAKGNTKNWQEAHQKNFPYLIYNADPQAPGPPAMMGGAQIPVALIQQATIAAQDIRDTSGLHEASFGEESGEKSGIALQRKQNQAEIVTYNFPDNMAKGYQRTWEILIDLIPAIYDAERELRVIGKDGEEDYKRVNQVVFDQASGRTLRLNDITAGEYDVTVTTGPSFATQRQEAAQVYSELFPPQSPQYPLVADLIAKSLDYPYAEEMAERLKMGLPPQIQQSLSEGKPLPPEIMQAKAQIEQQQQVMQQHGQLLQAASQEVDQKKAEAEKAQASVQTALEQLKTQQARFEAAVSKAEANIAKRESELAIKASQTKDDGERQSLENEIRSAAAQIQQLGAQLMESYSGHLSNMMAQPPPRVLVQPAPPHPKVVALHLHVDKNTGRKSAIPEYEQPPPQAPAAMDPMMNSGAPAPIPNQAG